MFIVAQDAALLKGSIFYYVIKLCLANTKRMAIFIPFLCHNAESYKPVPIFYN